MIKIHQRILVLLTAVCGLSFLAFALLAFQTPESTTQMKLAKQSFFLERVQYLAVQQARTVLGEALNTACHSKRADLARNTINFPAEYATKMAVTLVGGVNLIGTVTITPAVADDPATLSVNEATPESVTTSVTDGALLSQIATFWSHMSGCETGS